jgi:hypothetical protein
MKSALALVLAGCSFHAASSQGGDAGDSDARGHDAGRDGELRDAPADGPPRPIMFRQENDSEDTSLGVETVVFTKPQQAGDLDVVVVGWYKPGTVVSVADTSHDTYAIAAGPVMTSTGQESETIYYACGIGSAAAKANTVTVTFQGNGQDPDVRIAEYSGIRASACLDGAVSNTGMPAAMDSGNLATTHAHDLLVGANKVFYLTSTGDPMYMQRANTMFGDILEDREVFATGPDHAGATENMPGAWVMQLAAFKGD